MVFMSNLVVSPTKFLTLKEQKLAITSIFRVIPMLDYLNFVRLIAQIKSVVAEGRYVGWSQLVPRVTQQKLQIFAASTPSQKIIFHLTKKQLSLQKMLPKDFLTRMTYIMKLLTSTLLIKRNQISTVLHSGTPIGID